MSKQRSKFNRGTRFAKWVLGIGVANLPDEMRKEGEPVTVSAVYFWLRGETTPKMRHVKAMLAVAERIGAKPKIKMHDIFEHVEQEQKRREREDAEAIRASAGSDAVMRAARAS